MSSLKESSSSFQGFDLFASLAAEQAARVVVAAAAPKPTTTTTTTTTSPLNSSPSKKPSSSNNNNNNTPHHHARVVVNNVNDNNNNNNNAPLEKKKGYIQTKKEDKQHYDALRRIGKISNRDNKVASLPPLKQCQKTNKDCSCQELVDDLDAQLILRKNYINTIKNATSSDAGNLLLLNFLHIKPVKKDTKGTGKRSHYWYEVPKYDKSGQKILGRLTICCETFTSLFGFRPGSNKLRNLQKRKKDPNQCIQFKIRNNNIPRPGFGDDVKANLKKVLETEPREMVVAGDNSKRYYYGPNWSYFEFWKKYLRLFGTEDDQLFLQQAQSKRFYPTYHHPNKIKRKIVYTDADPQRRPSVSYSFACNYWAEFDLRFEDRKLAAASAANNNNAAAGELSSSSSSPADRMNQLAQAIGLEFEKGLRPTAKLSLLEEEILGEEQRGKLLQRIKVLEEELENDD